MKRGVAAAITIASVLGACSGGDDRTLTPPSIDPSTTAPAGTAVDDPSSPGTGGPGVVLSDGQPAAARRTDIPVVEGQPLDQAGVDEVLGHLPDWDVTPEPTPEIVTPPERLDPPVVGDSIEAPFPPAPADPPDAPAPTDAPLHVARHQPDGDVDVAPFLSVTFDQPMVPLTTLDQLEADPNLVPIELTPAVEGRWRWIGTRTARFEVVPDGAGSPDRLPAATEYTVTVPAGTTSANGAVLADTETWTFATPPPTVTALTGFDESMSTRPVWLAAFDQLVDPAAVLATTHLRVAGREVAVRLATPTEVDGDELARLAAEAAPPGRSVAIAPAEALPVDAAVELTVGPGTPSLEGPRVSERPHEAEGRTFGPLRVVDHSCNGDRGECRPLWPLSTELSNPIDPDLSSADLASLVTVEPAIAGMRVQAYDRVIEVSGETEARTTYRVTFGAGLTDVWGQSLGTDTTVEFRVGSWQPFLRGFDREFVTVDPLAPAPSVSVSTVNHDSIHVTAWEVAPDDVARFAAWHEQQRAGTGPADPPFPEVLDTDVPVDGPDDVPTETVVDLTGAFAAGGSQLVVRIRSDRDIDRDDELWWQNQPTIAWVQRTDLGVDAFSDGATLRIWTTDLTTGRPVADVPVDLIGDGRRVTTDASGLASVALSDRIVTALSATTAGGTALLVSDWPGAWQAQPRQAEGRWYLFDDRGVYRPGETARLAGWVRTLDWADDAQLGGYADADALTVHYVATDGYGNPIAEGDVEVNALGGFNLAVEVPDGANLGSGYVQLTLNGPGIDPEAPPSYGHPLRIEEFRRPEFEVVARTESAGPYFLDEGAAVAADATYFTGGALADAQVDWSVASANTAYAPPGWDDYHFGAYSPWWRASGTTSSVPFDCWECPAGAATVERFSGRTDGDGTHVLNIAFGTGDAPDADVPLADDLPRTVTAEATVFDVNRQAWSDRTDLLVHPARQYVGLRTERSFVRPGRDITIEAVATDVDGAVAEGAPITVTVGRVEWTVNGGTWAEELVDPAECRIVSGAEPTVCTFTPDTGGTYRVTAIVTDEDGATSRTELTVWVAGGTSRPARTVAQQELTIVPATDELHAGDTAEVLVQAPFAPASGVYTIGHGPLRETVTFDAPDGSAVLRVPITEADVPGLALEIEMTGTTARVDDDGEPVSGGSPRPAYAVGRIDLPVPPVERTLDVTVTPDAAELEPGTSTSVTVSVADADGRPVGGADVAVVVVDEAVLALTGYQLGDPLDVFYGPLGQSIEATYARGTIVLTRADLAGTGGDDDSAEATTPVAGDPGVLEMPTAIPESAETADSSSRRDAASAPVAVRSNFDALALFAPAETTAEDGTVTVAVELPDSLTRYRVMAVAVSGETEFGKAEAAITARLPLMVRPSAPRFLNFGDRFDLPVVLQNQTDADLTVDVAVETVNLDLPEVAGKRVTVPANDRVEVRFPAAAAGVGTAHYRVVAVGAGDATALVDAAEGQLPVYTPATAEAFASYGVLDGGEVTGQPVVAPTDVFAGFGGLEITTSSTAVSALTDAVLYIADYPYASSDGLASQIISIATLRDVLEAFQVDGLPTPGELDEAVAGYLTDLIALQNDDGGWSWWQRGRPSQPWVTVTAAHALVVADRAGYGVAPINLDRALGVLANVDALIPAEWGPEARAAVQAYAVYVRGEAGQRDPARAEALYADAGDALQLDGLAWLWPSIDDPDARAEIAATVANRAVDTAGAASFATSYGEDAYLVAASDRRTDAIVLDALLTQTPDTDLIPKVVAGLMAGQTVGDQFTGHWRNNYENAFALVALHRYFTTFESVTPDFVARVWLGDEYVAESAFTGRSVDRASTRVPMQHLIDATAADGAELIIADDGSGRLYYRLGVRYAPADLDLDPRDEGFVVDRVYEAVDDPADVTRAADGTWQIRAGARVRVRLTMVADAVRTHVGLIDPLPAGLEALNPSLAVTQTSPADTSGESSAADDTARPTWWWGWNWFEHQNLGDDRVEAFASYLPGGTYEYTYVARATTPGTFVVPPTRAEQIYAPETFGRSGSDTLVIADAG